jgi:hypothetical protein
VPGPLLTSHPGRPVAPPPQPQGESPSARVAAYSDFACRLRRISPSEASPHGRASTTARPSQRRARPRPHPSTSSTRRRRTPLRCRRRRGPRPEHVRPRSAHAAAVVIVRWWSLRGCRQRAPLAGPPARRFRRGTRAAIDASLGEGERLSAQLAENVDWLHLTRRSASTRSSSSSSWRLSGAADREAAAGEAHQEEAAHTGTVTRHGSRRRRGAGGGEATHRTSGHSRLDLRTDQCVRYAGNASWSPKDTPAVCVIRVMRLSG